MHKNIQLVSRVLDQAHGELHHPLIHTGSNLECEVSPVLVTLLDLFLTSSALRGIKAGGGLLVLLGLFDSWSETVFGCLCGMENICRHCSIMGPGSGGPAIMDTSYRVARILVNPTAAWMTVCPTPHIAA